MTASSAEFRTMRRLPLIGCVTVLSVLLAAAATAQPIMLKRATPEIGAQGQPDAAGPGAGGPEGAGQPAGDAGAGAGVNIPLRPLDKGAIVVNSLDAVNIDAVGLIGPEEGGFETSLWQGTGWPVVASLVPRMPEMSVSPAIRSLASRLLLSRGVVPEGKPETAGFVRMRVDRLLAMGQVTNALALLRVVPEERRDEAFSRIEVDALFLDNRQSDACARVGALVGRFQDSYWRQAHAFCLALNGEHARAALIGDLLRERDADAHPAFFAGIERLGGLKNKDVELPASPSGLILSLALSARLAIPENIVKNARPSTLRLLALSPQTDPELRLLASERAHALGALTDDQVVQLYQAYPFTENELRHPITTAEGGWGPRIRALLIRAAANQPVSLGKAEVLRRAWQLAAERGGLAETVRASMPVVAAMSPNPALANFAAEAARALFAGGRVAEAMGWYDIVAADSDRLPELRKAADSLWPIAVLADTKEIVVWDEERLTAWYVALRERDPENALRLALTYFTVLEAVGRDVPAALWQKLLDGPMVSLEPGLNRAWARNLENAAESGRVGETVLLLVSGAAATGDRTFPSDAAGYRAIIALRRAGLELDARRLAVETAIAAGL